MWSLSMSLSWSWSQSWSVVRGPQAEREQLGLGLGLGQLASRKHGGGAKSTRLSSWTRLMRIQSEANPWRRTRASLVEWAPHKSLRRDRADQENMGPLNLSRPLFDTTATRSRSLSSASISSSPRHVSMPVIPLAKLPAQDQLWVLLLNHTA